MSHIYLTQEIARNMNKKYPGIFPRLPYPMIHGDTGKIMSLSDPTKKMSKSESDKGTVYILEAFKKITEKIKKATTDAEQIVKYDVENKPGVSNLIAIYSSLSDKSYSKIEKEFEGKTYKDFKEKLLQLLEAELIPLQYRVNNISDEQAIKVLEQDEEFVTTCEKVNMNRIKGIIGL
jgi:tryptophanyl-tRNA synthetase